MERHLKPGEHLTLHRRNRALVRGRTSRLRADAGAWAGCAFGSLVAFALGSAFVYGFFGFPHGDQTLTATLLLLVGLVLLVGSAGGVVQLVSLVRDRRRRGEHGRLLTGEVTQVEEHYVQTMVQTGFTAYAGHDELRIFYSYLAPTGEEREEVVEVPKSRWRPRPSPRDRLAVLYVDEADAGVM